MPLQIQRSAAAIKDLGQLARFLRDQSPDLAERFLDAAEAAFALLAANPELGTRHRSRRQGLKELRIWSIRAFPQHLIFYRQAGATLRIVRVVHGARGWETHITPD